MNQLTIHKHRESSHLRAYKAPYKAPTEPTIKTPILTTSGFRNFAFCNLIFAFSTRLSRPNPLSRPACQPIMTLIITNKPNFDKGQNKLNPLCKRGLRKFYTTSDNEKQTQSNPISKAKKCPGTVFSLYFKQFEKRLVTERLSGDYLENREKDERNKSFIACEIWPE